MTVLIFTEPDDIHAALVKLALEKKGVDCHSLFTADMPTKQRSSIKLSNDHIDWLNQRVDEEPHRVSEINFSAVWFRRPRRPHLPATLHPDDEAFVRRENQVYHDSIPYLINPEAWWVNPYHSLKRANSKIAQLKLASELGFRIPKTLISNCHQQIRQFINAAPCGEIIYKSFTPQYWPEKKGIKLLYTNRIRLSDLHSDKMLQAVPGIYQQYIKKKFELRITCFGSNLSAVKIKSQSHPMGIADWRKIPSSELTIEEYALPNSLKNKILSYLQQMGLVFGCFDFIVTPEDELYFLEQNEQGQFLWVEDILPEMKYLDRFVQFILQGQFHFQWKDHSKAICSRDLDAAAEKLVHQQIEKHVYLNRLGRAS